ncbi:Alpha-(1,3)-fucosyltransferase 11 [Lobosporangium transversale]|nr:Alpha-(1,3)-fucosyltransferase 11 [Lobosporangium transversale]
MTYFTAGTTKPNSFINLVSRPPLRTIEQKNRYRQSGFHPADRRPLAPVAWIVSNCKASNGRHLMVKQLLKYIDIDIYGRCISNRPWPKKMLDNNSQIDMPDEELVGHYKFYLAIENSNCEDYVTEKLERTFGAGAVPVVDGPDDYSRFMPSPRSLIRYDDHGSPRKLAQFLKYLDQNDTAYQEYLTYRTPRSPNNTDAQGNVLIQSPETFNQDYRERLSPWFVDNWDLDRTGLFNKTTEWLSTDGPTRTTRAKYGMQWGPDLDGGMCAACRVAHELTEGSRTLSPSNRLTIDQTCKFRKFYYTSWIISFYPYLTLLILCSVLALLFLLLTKTGRAIIFYLIRKIWTLLIMVRERLTKTKRSEYHEFSMEDRR